MIENGLNIDFSVHSSVPEPLDYSTLQLLEGFFFGGGIVVLSAGCSSDIQETEIFLGLKALSNFQGKTVSDEQEVWQGRISVCH